MMAKNLAPYVDRLEEGLLSMDRSAIPIILEQAREREGLDLPGVADAVIVPALERIGDGWETGTVALSQVYMAGRILQEVINDGFVPLRERVRPPVIGIGVLEDHHALGKRILLSVLRCAGYDVRNLGAGRTPAELVDGAEAERVQILMVSVLMLNRARHVRRVREILDERGLDGIRLVVGGAPFVHDPGLWKEVGADACGRNAADALRLAASSAGGEL